MSKLMSYLPRPMGWHWAFWFVGAFLVLFGLLNFAELPLGWKDRVPQISRYLAATFDLGPQWALPTLWFLKAAEGLLGLLALVGLLRRDTRCLVAAVLGWLVVFAGYSGMDVWADDRLELLEHSLYFAGFSLLLLVLLVLSVLGGVLATLSAGTPAGQTRVPVGAGLDSAHDGP